RPLQNAPFPSFPRKRESITDENACPRPDPPATARHERAGRGLDSRFHGNDNLDYFYQNSKVSICL
ncbi:MAG: hypothetical protein KJ635_06125, partial [Proteobacteria bacterium]|nr:hypothetical protein [Pseudomonadota bacterium]